MTLQVKATGMKYWKTVQNDAGQVVAVLSQLSSGRWVLNDPNDKRLSNQKFDDISQAKKWMAEHQELFL